ncbi:MAG TPA: hypothetical protein VI457_00120 [Methylococcaceae bacterium]|nr:hypothetical protein [Methylococcaceae bacterium]
MKEFYLFYPVVIFLTITTLLIYVLAITGRIRGQLRPIVFLFALSNCAYALFYALSLPRFDHAGSYHNYGGEAIFGIYIIYIAFYFIALSRITRPKKRFAERAIYSLICGTIAIICFVGSLVSLLVVYFASGVIDSS